MTAKNDKKEVLGKGIRSLLQGIDNDLKTATGALKTNVAEAATGITRIPIEKIIPNPGQPRKDFSEQALSELAASIKIHDVIQPLTVTPSGDRYKLIAGERRYRAAKLAGLKDLPVYVRQANDQQVLELALLENLQREDLNSVEIALGYKRMMEELDYTQEQVAERMGKERSTVTNYIRLLKLPPDIQVAVRTGVISMGHAKALLKLEQVDRQMALFKEIKTKELSVRQAEELANRYNTQPIIAKPAAARTGLPPVYQRIEDKLASHFGARVKLKHSKKGNGTITLEYFSAEELNKMLSLMQVNIS
jgi:ParB family transcriptional regulator, chromosome partitioning protein